LLKAKRLAGLDCMTRATVLSAFGGFVLALAADFFFVFVNVSLGVACTTRSAGATVCHSTGETLLEQNGDTALLWLAVPTGLAALIFISTVSSVHGPRFVSWSAAIVLSAFCLLTGFPIGLFFIPAAVLALLSVLLGRLSSLAGAPD
jgi:hypothetical protein